MNRMKYNFDQSGKFISATIPKYAFKFSAVTDYAMEALNEKYLWFSKPDDLNDVFEVTIKNRKDYSKSMLKKFLIATLSHNWPKLGISIKGSISIESYVNTVIEKYPNVVNLIFDALRNERRKMVRLYCMSLCFNNPLMWAHYADNLRGICLVFLFPLLTQNKPWTPMPVNYVNRLPVYDPIESSLRILSSAEKYDNDLELIIYDQIHFGNKLKAWEHEQEIRLSTIDPNSKQYYDPKALVDVILGPKIAASEQKMVERAATNGMTTSLTVEKLNIDHRKASLTVSGIKNEFIQVKGGKIRNLAKELGLVVR